MPRKLALALVVLLSVECWGPFSPEKPSLDDLVSAPETIAIEGRIFTLETYLWRDFMPGSGPVGRDLIALIWVTAVDRQPFPASVDADRLWVVFGKEIWETEFSREERPQEPYRLHQLEKIARNGPKWRPSVEVDVIVRIVHFSGKYLLRASHQRINQVL